MRYQFVSALSILLAINLLQAQPASKARFHSIGNVGLVEGGSDENLQLQIINGIAFKGFFGGLGVGLDNYYLRSVPVFVDLRRNFSGKAKTPFLYLDVGAAFPWDKNKGTQWEFSHYKTGFLYDGGIGYSIPIKGRLSMNISAGYSQRFLKETKVSSRWYWVELPVIPPPSNEKDTVYYKYNFNRFSFKIGFSF